MNKDYEQEKQEIFKKADDRADEIISKYEVKAGMLDSEPWKKELRADSYRVLKQLKELNEKYKIK